MITGLFELAYQIIIVLFELQASSRKKKRRRKEPSSCYDFPIYLSSLIMAPNQLPSDKCLAQGQIEA